MPKIQFYVIKGVSKFFWGPPSTLSRNQNFQKSDFPHLLRFCHHISASYWSGGPKFIDRLLDYFFKTWLWLRAGVPCESVNYSQRGAHFHVLQFPVSVFCNYHTRWDIKVNTRHCTAICLQSASTGQSRHPIICIIFVHDASSGIIGNFVPINLNCVKVK